MNSNTSDIIKEDVSYKVDFMVLLKCIDKFEQSNRTEMIQFFQSKNIFQILKDKIIKLIKTNSKLNKEEEFVGFILILKKLYQIKLNQELFISIEFTKNLIEIILNGLFQIDINNINECPHIKGFIPRRACLSLLLQIIHSNDFELSQYVLFFFCFQFEQYWKNNENKKEVQIDFKEKNISTGLINLGNTCYVNSILQQLFNNLSFRENFLYIDSLGGNNQPLSPNLEQLRLLFARMKTTSLSYISSKEFCQSFRGFNNQPINPSLQQDAFEFLNLLVDSIDENLSENPKQLIMKHFKGNLVNEINSLEQDFPFTSTANESFLTIFIDPKLNNNLSQALDEFTNFEILDGDNALYRENFKKKVKSRRRSLFKELPETMIIVLKRFEYDQATFTRKKLDDLFEFPFEIDFKKWCVESTCNEHSNEYFDYELNGVVIHSGTSDFGHYYSHIKKYNSWFEFNDKKVFKINLSTKLLKNEWYGGTTKTNFTTLMNLNLDHGKSSKNAYILFYQRKSAQMNYSEIVEKEIPQNLKSQIDRENRELIGSLLFVDSQFKKFCTDFANILDKLNLDEILKIEENDEKKKEIVKLFIKKNMSRIYFKYFEIKMEQSEGLNMLDQMQIDLVNNPDIDYSPNNQNNVSKSNILYINGRK